MKPPELHVVVPGPIDQKTGGYLYDAHMVGGLRELGWRVEVHSLPGSFPDVGETERAALRSVLDSLPDGSRVLIDGLAMGALPGPVREHGQRLRIVSLVHHPLADETGLSPTERARLQASEAEALAACTGVIVTSPYTAGRLSDYGVPDGRVRPVLPGTEPAPRAEGPGSDEPPRLVCVASVTPRKGHDVLVAALDRISDLDWQCVCVGSLERDPEFVQSVLDAVTEAELTERIDFVGERAGPALEEQYRRASAFVLASHYEGYGMALAEALARGLPVVSTTGGAIPHTVPADAGILVEPGDAGAFAEALRSLLADPRRRFALAAATRRHAERLPTWEASALSFAAALDELTR